MSDDKTYFLQIKRKLNTETTFIYFKRKIQDYFLKKSMDGV